MKFPAVSADELAMIGDCAPMQDLAHRIRLVAPRRSTVLILGETGTGKEVAARAIHAASTRSQHLFFAVNCGALPGNLLEAELFGHTRGAFTGATATRIGRFEAAHGGTLFLDEIGDLPLELQTKLLRVLQEREIQRLGSSETIPVDVRVIAATNVNLEAKVRDGDFREDLFYRLNVVPLRIPPLRERRSDIPLLARYFVGKVCEGEGIPEKRLRPEAEETLMAHDWPGNVRQLENAIEMAVALSGERRDLRPEDFPLPARRTVSSGDPIAIPLPESGIDFERTIQAIELSLLRQALDRAKGNKSRAAGILHLNRTTLTAKLRSLSATA
jgi:transcriptional regulator with GAF, ATPase, and Fis domain